MTTEHRDGMIAPGTKLEHYQILSRLGAGGMGEVYLAQDLRLGRKVALKMLLPELTLDESDLRRFEHEARATSALNHPNILTIYEFGQAEGLRFIVSEYIEGLTLRDKMASGRMELSTAIDVAIQIASALAAAHACGIVHRDIKPDNVIVRADGIVKVLDLGIAKLGHRAGDQTIGRGLTVTSTASTLGMVVGTAKYMSPEQARGGEVDGRSDIFSLGSVMYEMVTGRGAFDGVTASDVMAEILKVEPPPVEFVLDVPQEIEHIIGKALRKDRETRFQSVGDLLIDLRDFKKEAEFQAKLHRSTGGQAAGTGSGSRTPARATHALTGDLTSSPTTWPRIWLWRLAALLVAIAAIGYFYARRSTPPTSARPRSLAILPFRNLKQDPETDFLGFSLADAIITKLGYVNALSIRPSSSIDKYRNQIIDPKKVAADLNVDTLLTGSYIKDGDDLRITAQLIDVKSDKILWRDSIDLKYDKLLTVQDRVAQQIIKQLDLNLSPTEAANLRPEKPINNAAYEDYLRGIDFYALNVFPAAIEMLEKATQLQPDYAPAWAHLGRAYTTNA